MAFDFDELRVGILNLFAEAQARARTLRRGALDQNERGGYRVKRSQCSIYRCELCGSMNTPAHRCAVTGVISESAPETPARCSPRTRYVKWKPAKNACQACGSRVPPHLHICQIVASAAE